jgi:hypothetical protein
LNFKVKKIVFAVAVILMGCGPSVFTPLEKDVENGKKKYPDLTMAQMHEGFTLFSDKCSSCHRLFKPKELSLFEWDKALPEMKMKAKLNDKEYDLICRYIHTMHGDQE